MDLNNSILAIIEYGTRVELTFVEGTSLEQAVPIAISNSKEWNKDTWFSIVGFDLVFTVAFNCFLPEALQKCQNQLNDFLNLNE